MPRMILLLFLMFLIFATLASTVAFNRVLTTPLQAQELQSATPEDRLEALDRWLQSLYDSKRFNGTVLIGDSERILFSKTYGFEDPEFTSALTESSAFNLASVSKQFTAMAILLLEHEGTLSVSDRLRDHVPEMDIYPEITIEQLLHHTSGIADYMRLAIKHKADRELTRPQISSRSLPNMNHHWTSDLYKIPIQQHGLRFTRGNNRACFRTNIRSLPV